MSTDIRSLQTWPSGRTYYVSGSYPHYRVHDGYYDPTGRDATPDENRTIQAAYLAEGYAQNEILCCDSALVSALMERGDIEGFSCDDVQNEYADPSDWNLEQCRDYLQDHGAELPEADPWEMGREALAEALESVGIECRDDETDDTLREAVIANIDDETIDGLDDWRDAVREYSSDNPQEAYEWWRVTGWLCQRLCDIGEIVIDNDFGCWWGRTCTGQSMLMDGTLQQVAYNSLDAAESYTRQ